MKHLPLLLVGLLLGFQARAELSPREIGRRLGDIRVKQVNFRQAKVPEVIETLGAIAREAENPVNIVLENPDIVRQPITLELRGKSLRQILRLVCRMSDLRMQVRNGILFIGETD